MSARRLERLAFAAVALTVVVQAALLYHYKQRILPGSGMPSREEAPAVPFGVGDVLAGATVKTLDGAEKPISTLWTGDEFVVLFYRAGCPTCDRNLASLHDYAEVTGTKALAIECSGRASSASAYSDRLVAELSILTTGTLGHKLKHSPQVLSVNRCGIVVASYKDITGLMTADAAKPPRVTTRSGAKAGG